MNIQLPDKLPPCARKTACAKVRFVLLNPEAQEVFVAGTFNNWNPTSTPLKNIGQGRWLAELVLPVGRYEYQFVVDSRWVHDRATRELIENPFGGINSLLEVRRPQFTLTPIAPPPVKVNSKWRWHYHELLKLHRRLFKDRLEQINEAVEPLERHKTHLADIATDELDHELAIGELRAQENLLYEVEQAVQRILDGTYGKCEVTGKPIPAARLHAVPWTPYSKEVEEELEKLHS